MQESSLTDSQTQIADPAGGSKPAAAAFPPRLESLRSLNWGRWILTALLFALILAAPLLLSDFRLSLLGRFLAYAILAIGIDLIWGYTGILSLGHGVWFGLGAYCTAMYLKLEASGGQVPDFMSWSGLETLPFWWKPFASPWFAIAAAMIVPAALAALLGYFTFRNRIKGVFFAIISQALAIIVVTLFIGQQAFTGGTNGMTGFETIFGRSINDASSQRLFFYITAIVLALVYLGSQRLVSGRFGKILIAIRDGENRMRFTGYNPVAYKVFIFALSAGIAGLAGVLFVLQVGIIAPAQMGIVPSIEMVLWVALGGRGTLAGAVLGAIVVNSAQNAFSEQYPATWSYLMGAAFLLIVLFMPQGVMGGLNQLAGKWLPERWFNAAKRNTDSQLVETGGTA